MATAYLTDAAVWITICAARLLEVGARSDPEDAENTAADLYEDPAYRAMTPTAAAQAWHEGRTGHRQAA